LHHFSKLRTTSAFKSKKLRTS